MTSILHWICLYQIIIISISLCHYISRSIHDYSGGYQIQYIIDNHYSICCEIIVKIQGKLVRLDTPIIY